MKRERERSLVSLFGSADTSSDPHIEESTRGWRPVESNHDHRDMLDS
jgi:hypothetical protein